MKFCFQKTAQILEKFFFPANLALSYLYHHLKHVGVMSSRYLCKFFKRTVPLNYFSDQRFTHFIWKEKTYAKNYPRMSADHIANFSQLETKTKAWKWNETKNIVSLLIK